ncbi:MAG: hypothetical protein CM15mP120_06190 [Pseudomonadota bacterium]|nr:MAG: hypothetical protein CM15mP120_06190 [Pseudomonadota bacterium]
MGDLGKPGGPAQSFAIRGVLCSTRGLEVQPPGPLPPPGENRPRRRKLWVVPGYGFIQTPPGIPKNEAPFRGVFSHSQFWAGAVTKEGGRLQKPRGPLEWSLFGF